tara:strand:- start:375 stop:485 length:111 start_codon:yes stop_codon:yes gene_type:complete
MKINLKRNQKGKPEGASVVNQKEKPDAERKGFLNSN